MFNLQSLTTHPNDLQNCPKQLTCIYRNESAVIQIIRISQPNSAFLERSVLPNQYIHFSASINALLEVYEGIMSGVVHADTIPCSQLAIDIDNSQQHPNSKVLTPEVNKDLQGLLIGVA